jgi:hypothetical protein
MFSGNVTVDPAAPATAVADPEIKEVRSTRSGLILPTQQYIAGQRYDRIIRVRNLIRDAIAAREPRMVCAICGVPVNLVSSPRKAFFFRHTIEDGSCPAQTRGAWSYDQIKAMKYHGAQENDAHRRIKVLLERSLRADPHASDIHQEKTWRAAGRPASYRRPDVQALYEGIRLAIEAQLSTTFLDVVVGRRAFYREEGALLIWVLPRFDPGYRRLTEDDILFTNNSNILVVNEETAKLSEATSRCTFHCYYREPYLDGETVSEAWSERLVTLDELSFDLPGQRVFAFDFDQECARLRTELVERRARQAQQLRADFTAFWIRNGCSENCDPDRDEQWAALRERFLQLGIEVPVHHMTGEFRAAISGLMSAKLGRPVGLQFRKLVEVAHNLAERHTGVLRAFGWALKVYGTRKIIEAEDVSRRWQRKEARIHDAMMRHSPAYATDLTWSAALRFIFPELANKIAG